MKQNRRTATAMKKQGGTRRDVAHLEDVPNVGTAIAADFRRLGIATPTDLIGRDPYALYDELCRVAGVRHDPCVLDVFLAAVRYMEGAPKRPWWKYTAERKRELAARAATPFTPTPLPVDHPHRPADGD